MNFVTYENLTNCICKNIYKLPHDLDLIAGIPRSGLMVATILALYMNLPVTDIDGLLNGKILSTGKTRKNPRWIKSINDAKKVLVIDDSISTGEAIKRTKKRIETSGLKSDVIYCAVYALPSNFFSVDIFFEICNHPRMFEWNYLHHWMLEHACFDIDGVLCEDPGIFQNDDGNRYINFIRNAPPKLIPTKKIGYLVTCRLEKYRYETEQWLKNHDIQYNRLIMLNEKSGLERIKNFKHGEFKGHIYKNTDCFIFIESNYEQAVKICEVSKKQVFCVENRKLISSTGLQAHINVVKNDWRFTLKRVIKKLILKS